MVDHIAQNELNYSFWMAVMTSDRVSNRIWFAVRNEVLQQLKRWAVLKPPCWVTCGARLLLTGTMMCCQQTKARASSHWIQCRIMICAKGGSSLPWTATVASGMIDNNYRWNSIVVQMVLRQYFYILNPRVEPLKDFKFYRCFLAVLQPSWLCHFRCAVPSLASCDEGNECTAEQKQTKKSAKRHAGTLCGDGGTLIGGLHCHS